MTASELRRSSYVRSDPNGQGASLTLSVSRDIKLIATVRRFVGELCVRVLGDPDITSRVVVATHELLDNAVRHGIADATIQVSVRCVDEAAEVAIDTTNRIEPERIPRLQRLVDEMRENDGRRMPFYLELMKRAARREEGAGLGLGRVHAESEMSVSTRFEDGLVFLRADGRFPLLLASSSSSPPTALLIK